MDFFASQDRARRNTKLLVFYFLMSIVGIIFVLWGLACLGLAYSDERPVFDWRPDILAVVTIFTLVVVLIGSWYKTLQLRAGGEYVARMLGGRPVLHATTDLAERRLLNVVEEMALAAGIPAPPVFVLDDEESINAFAAGFTPADAVIGVNRGTLMYLNRDELQGVIAHEFSHIINGDMRLNLRLIGLLHGILLISVIGYYLMRAAGRLGRGSSRKRGEGGMYLFLVGLALWLVGSIGVFFARLIKAAISRQREYLADAAAVQFTRYPDGIAGALKKIGGLLIGSRVRHPAAEEASHMFFSSAFDTWLSGLLATHPPLRERIRRIDPSFDGKFPRVEPLVEAPKVAAEVRRPGRRPAARGAVPLTPVAKDRFRLEATAALASIGQLSAAAREYATELLEKFPAAVRQAAEEPFSARTVVFGLLLERDEAVRAQQLEIVRRREGEPTVAATLKLRAELSALPAEWRLPLLHLVQGTLRHMSREQYLTFRGTVEELIQTDQKITVLEFIIHRILISHLDRHFFAPPPLRPTYHSVRAVEDAAVVLLSLVAHAGRTEPQEAEAGYRAGTVAAGLDAAAPLLPLQECSLARVQEALDKLRLAIPAVKKRILSGIFVVAAKDALLTVAEAELMRAIAESLDCPMPPLFAGALPPHEQTHS